MCRISKKSNDFIAGRQGLCMRIYIPKKNKRYRKKSAALPAVKPQKDLSLSDAANRPMRHIESEKFFKRHIGVPRRNTYVFEAHSACALVCRFDVFPFRTHDALVCRPFVGDVDDIKMRRRCFDYEIGAIQTERAGIEVTVRDEKIYRSGNECFICGARCFIRCSLVRRFRPR